MLACSINEGQLLGTSAKLIYDRDEAQSCPFAFTPYAALQRVVEQSEKEPSFIPNIPARIA